MTDLTIIRGLPGSGKSTLASNLISDWGFYEGHPCGAPVHLEADMYFTKNGEYKYVSSEIQDAHKYCFAAAEALLILNKQVVVSNTFVEIWQMEGYIDMALRENKSITIYECTGKYGSIHNVPEESMQRMASKWQRLPKEWEAYRKATP